MKKQQDGFVAVMPFSLPGTKGWDWFGASLARIVYDKLLVAGLRVIPFFELGHLDPRPEVELLTNWEEYSLMSDYMQNGHILTGGYVFGERRVKINAYVVQPTGLSLLAMEDETKETFVRIIDRICHEIAAVFGKRTNAKMRERIQATTPTTSREAFDAMVAALDAWSSKDLKSVRKAVRRAEEIDPEYLDPVELLAMATRELGSASELTKARKALLTRAMASPLYYRALAIADEMLAEANRSGNNDLVTDCLKTQSAIQGSTGEDSIAQEYAKRIQELDSAMAGLLGKDELERLRILRKKGWSTGQVVALLLMGQSWEEQTRAALQVGQFATASSYADRARGLYRVLGSAKRRKQVTELIRATRAALAAS